MYTSEINNKYLKKLDLNKNVLNTEGNIYLYPDKGYCKNYKLLKLYYDNQSIYFSNKMFTIHQLITNKEEILKYVPNLVLPDYLVLQKSQIVGYAMDYIESVNLSEFLSNIDNKLYTKIEYLKQVGNVLENLKLLRKYSSIDNMFLNDIHEDNFVVNKKGELYVVDIDACKIEANIPMVGKLLTGRNTSLKNIPNKYHETTNEFGTVYTPNEQTDLYCFCIMILNFLYGKREVQNMSIDEYYDYLSYLENLGISKDLLNVFQNLYTPFENVNPKDLLESIKDIYPKSHKNVYNVRKKRI